MRAAAAAALVAAACTVQLPPPAAPEQVVPRPNVVLGAPAPGEGDVVIDTVGGPADVVDSAGFGSSVVARTVCTTPCEVHLAQGLHDLTFIDQQSGEWRGDGRITVGAVPSAYRYALGHQDVSVGGLSVGVLMLIVGPSLLFTGAVASSPTLAGVGGVLTGLGILGLYLLRPHVQHGTGVQ